MSCTTPEFNRLFRGRNRQLAPALIALVWQFRDYWPMTLRAFYYQAVSALLVENTEAEYRRVGKILALLRREELIPWRSMEDKTRRTTDKRGLPEVSEFIEGQLESFLDPRYYGRCYIQEQQVHVEVSVEKDAISNHVEEAAWMFCTLVNVTRGQPSATLLNNMAERFDKAIMQGKEAVLLHFGDLDPTGVQIPRSIAEGFAEHHDIMVDVRQMALTPGQCIEHNLPQSLQAAKANDPNIERWYAAYGDQAPTEIDALHPEVMKQLVESSLASVYNMDEVNDQKKKEKVERRILQKMRKSVVSHLCDDYPDMMREVGYL